MFTRHFESGYSAYIVEPYPIEPQSLAWMKTWTSEQRKFIFQNFAYLDHSGNPCKLQGMDIRPYLRPIANILSEVKGYNIITGGPLPPKQLELDLSVPTKSVFLSLLADASEQLALC